MQIHVRQIKSQASRAPAFALQQLGQEPAASLGNTHTLGRRGPLGVNRAPWTARTSSMNDTRETETVTIAGRSLVRPTALGF